MSGDPSSRSDAVPGKVAKCYLSRCPGVNRASWRAEAVVGRAALAELGGGGDHWCGKYRFLAIFNWLSVPLRAHRVC
ncbi:MAG: hypothetical protein AMXMBFR64_06310 [Myxococcales bacterium]